VAVVKYKVIYLGGSFNNPNANSKPTTLWEKQEE
jgi:hypothetical protein